MSEEKKTQFPSNFRRFVHILQFEGVTDIAVKISIGKYIDFETMEETYTSLISKPNIWQRIYLSNTWLQRRINFTVQGINNYSNTKVIHSFSQRTPCKLICLRLTRTQKAGKNTLWPEQQHIKPFMLFIHGFMGRRRIKRKWNISRKSSFLSKLRVHFTTSPFEHSTYPPTPTPSPNLPRHTIETD